MSVPGASWGLPTDVAIAVRTAIGLMFLLAAVGKLRHRAVFPGIIANYRVLPAALVLPFARLLPVAESVIGCALLAGRGTPATEAAAAALLGSFAFAIGVNLRRGRAHVDCGCFQSALRQRLRWSLVARNAGMLALLVGVALMPPAPAGYWTRLNGVLAGCALFLVVQAFDALWAVDFRGRRTAPPLTTA